MRGRGGDHFPLNFQVLQSSSCYLAQAGERAEEQSEQGEGLRQNLEFTSKDFVNRRPPSKKPINQTFVIVFLETIQIGPLGGVLRQEQPVSQAECTRQCGEGCDADRLGISYF